MIHSVATAEGAGNRKARAVGAAFLAGAGFGGVEAVAVRASEHPLDPALSAGAALGWSLGLGALFALVALALSRWSVRYSAALAVALWAAVWGPELARILGLAAAWGALGPLILLLLGSWRPSAAALLGALCGALIPLARPGLTRPAELAPLPSSTPRLPSLLLVTVDTVRADAGLLDPPALTQDEQLAPVSLPQVAISAAPWTLPAMYSLMTGLPVVEHGGGLPTDGGFTRVDLAQRGLTERLRQAGYETSAVVCNPHLRAEMGFAAGFTRWLHDDDAREPALLWRQLARWRERWTGEVSQLRHTRDDRLLAVALSELRRALVRPRFLWVHLLGPHEYGRDAEDPPEGWEPGTDVTPVLQAAYRGNVLAARRRVLTLVHAARVAGWGAAVTSDHGEAFGEGGHQGHGHALQDAELAVPLALWPPGRRPVLGEASALDGPLATVNLAYTMLSWAGLEAGFPGEDLLTTRPAPIAVGGLRREARAFAIRQPSGDYTPEPRAPASGLEPAPPDAETTRLLRLLGYEDGAGHNE